MGTYSQIPYLVPDFNGIASKILPWGMGLAAVIDKKDHRVRILQANLLFSV